jgi:hypothetical protein
VILQVLSADGRVELTLRSERTHGYAIRGEIWRHSGGRVPRSDVVRVGREPDVGCASSVSGRSAACARAIVPVIAIPIRAVTWASRWATTAAGFAAAHVLLAIDDAIWAAGSAAESVRRARWAGMCHHYIRAGWPGLTHPQVPRVVAGGDALSRPSGPAGGRDGSGDPGWQLLHRQDVTRRRPAHQRTRGPSRRRGVMPAPEHPTRGLIPGTRRRGVLAIMRPGR